MKLSTAFLAGLSSVVLAVIALDSPAQGTAHDAPQTLRDPGPGATSATKTHHYSNGPANCNCTQSEAHLTVSIGKTVTVSIGDRGVKMSTGGNSGQSASQTVPPGKCIYYQYHFTCEGWLFTKYTFVSASLKERNATDEDC